MWRAPAKLALLAMAACLPWLQVRTVQPRDAAEWEACLQELNPQGYRYVIAEDPESLMEKAHWGLYLDEYSLKSTNFTPRFWRFDLTPKDVQLMLHAHRHPETRAALTPEQEYALSKAEQMVARLVRPDMDDMQKAVALHDELVTTCTYSLKGAENATDMFLLHNGTCEAFGRSLRLLLELAGIPCPLVYGKVAGGVRHCWNKACINGQWLHIDPAWNAAASTPGLPSHTFFAVSPDLLRFTHTWKEE